MNILALDPGRTTGYALSVDGTVGYGQLRLEPREFWDFLNRYLPVDVECHVVCEDFSFRQGSQHEGIDLYPCELIGILKLHRTFHVDMSHQLYFQPASVQGRKAYFSDKMLKDMGFYIKGVEHGRSAVKHLFYWLLFGPGYQYGIDMESLRLIDLAEGG